MPASPKIHPLSDGRRDFSRRSTLALSSSPAFEPRDISPHKYTTYQFVRCDRQVHMQRIPSLNSSLSASSTARTHKRSRLAQLLQRGFSGAFSHIHEPLNEQTLLERAEMAQKIYGAAGASRVLPNARLLGTK